MSKARWFISTTASPFAPNTRAMLPRSCSTERMFKINCKTSADGLIHELNVTIYNSIELMSADLFEDLRLHERRGTFRAKREHVQIMNDFNCGL